MDRRRGAKLDVYCINPPNPSFGINSYVLSIRRLYGVYFTNPEDMIKLMEMEVDQIPLFGIGRKLIGTLKNV